MKNKYSAKIEGETARALGRDLSISKKHAVEVCRWLRKRKVSQAKNLLNQVLKMKLAVPYKRHTWNLAHKKSTRGPGRYPIKACKEILSLVESAETNAQFKGMNTANLIIAHINAHQASRPWHFGRQRRRKMKRSHVEVIVKEGKKKEVKKETKKPEISKEKKVSEKPAQGSEKK